MHLYSFSIYRVLEETFTKEVIMVRPAAFGFDEDTMASNAFQKADVAKTLTVHQIQVQNKRYIYIYKFKTN